MADNSSSITAEELSSGGTESLGWLNDILKQMWPNINAAAATNVKETAEGLPRPLNGLKLTKISLGSAPPKFDNIGDITQTEGSIELNIDLSWIAEDYDIELETRISSARVENIKLVGRLSATLLVENDFSFYKEPPSIARLTVVSGNNFRPESGFLRKDVPDIFVKTKFGAFDQWQTSVQKNAINPVWNERKDFVFSDDDQVIKVEAWDEDTFSSDDHVGTASATVKEFLLEDSGMKTLQLADKDGSLIEGDITLQLEAYKCVSDLSSFELADFGGNGCICGFMIILVGKGIDIPVPKTYVKVEWGPSHNFVTAPIYATNPSYDTPFLIPMTQELFQSNKEHDVVFTVIDSDVDGAELGTTNVTFDSIMESSTKTITGDKEESIGDEGLKLRYQVSLRGLSK